MTSTIMIKVKLMCHPCLVSEVQLDISFRLLKDLTVTFHLDPPVVVVLPVFTTYCIAINIASLQRPELSNIVRMNRDAANDDKPLSTYHVQIVFTLGKDRLNTIIFRIGISKISKSLRNDMIVIAVGHK